jgi:hypothetical protein
MHRKTSLTGPLSKREKSGTSGIATYGILKEGPNIFTTVIGMNNTKNQKPK